MEKIMKIEGMACNNCKSHVEKALNALPGVSAQVVLSEKTASIQSDGRTANSEIKAAVSKAGYTVVSLDEV